MPSFLLLSPSTLVVGRLQQYPLLNNVQQVSHMWGYPVQVLHAYVLAFITMVKRVGNSQPLNSNSRDVQSHVIQRGGEGGIGAISLALGEEGSNLPQTVPRPLPPQ